MVKDIEELYNDYRIQRRHDDPDESQDKYPPDWNYRQAAVLDYHNETCARCRRKVGSSSNVLQFHVHHVLPLHKNGSHKLQNLVPLCKHCHALIHPYQEDLGDFEQAPLFPAQTADPRVAVERIPSNDIERTLYDNESNTDQIEVDDDVNVYARSEETTDISSKRTIQKENPTKNKIKNLEPASTFTFFCNDCGEMIDPGTKKCESCKQGSVGELSTRHVVLVGGVLLVVLVILFFLLVL